MQQLVCSVLRVELTRSERYTEVKHKKGKYERVCRTEEMRHRYRSGWLGSPRHVKVCEVREALQPRE